MAITRYEESKEHRYFYVNSYRKIGRYLLISVMLNILLVMVISYVYFNQPGSSFYGTNGQTSPIKLMAINTPNYSAEALLPSEE